MTQSTKINKKNDNRSFWILFGLKNVSMEKKTLSLKYEWDEQKWTDRQNLEIILQGDKGVVIE